jgi:hypothetical protein
MISTVTSIPVRILLGNNVNVIRHNPAEAIARVIRRRSDRQVDEVHNRSYTNGEEEYMGLIGILGPEWAPLAFDLIDEMALNGIDVV